MLRPTKPEDTPALLSIAEGTKVFKPHEIVALREVLDDFHAAPREHQAYTEEVDGQVIGFVYIAPASMTENVWYLYWIFIEKSIQAQGLGTKLLLFAEEQIRQAKGRLLLIETSGLPHYLPTRNFYLKHGYTLEAVVREFYAVGDDLNVFRKAL
jgi:GNAT superfamily N-acetyltransferase